MYKVSIIGLGIENQFKNMNHIKLAFYNIEEEYKKKLNNIISSDIVFICLSTLYNEKQYDISTIFEICKQLNEQKYTGYIIIKSTIEPETTDNLSKKYSKLKIIHNPDLDTDNQSSIILGKGNNCTGKDMEYLYDFYKTSFPMADISICSSLESESIKIFSDSFYAVKIHFFNELYLLCQSNNSNYNTIRDLMIKNGCINPTHTLNFGTDRKLSYHFTDVANALLNYMKSKESKYRLLDAIVKQHNKKQSNNYISNIISNFTYLSQNSMCNLL